MRLIDADDFLKDLAIVAESEHADTALKNFAKNVVLLVVNRPTVPILKNAIDKLKFKSIDCDSKSGLAVDYIDMVEALTNKEFAEKVWDKMKKEETNERKKKYEKS